MSSARPRVLVLTYTRVDKSPRPLKQVGFLRERFQLTTAGFGTTGVPGVEHIELPDQPLQRGGRAGRLLYFLLLLVRWHRPISWLSARDSAVRRILGAREWDVVIAHDLWCLAAAVALRPSRGIVVDLHEYAPAESEQSFVWRLLMRPYVKWLCRKVPSVASRVITVSPGIAAEYKSVFGIDSVVVENFTPYVAHLTPGAVARPIRLVHSGIAVPERRLEILIDAVIGSRADVTLDLYLVGNDEGYLGSLRKRAETDGRIRLHSPVPYRELISTLNTFDVGLHVLPPTNFNLLHALPNKVFDYVQARLGLIVGPSPAMAGLVTDFQIGAVLPDYSPEALRHEIEGLEPHRVSQWKSSAQEAAFKLSSEQQSEVWVGLVDQVLAGKTD